MRVKTSRNIQRIILELLALNYELYNLAVKNGTPGRIRTCDTWLRRPVLYPG